MLRGEDLAHVFASLDVFVHPGEAETYCQTVQEAQASGVPVVAPAAGGPLDLVDHGRSGVLFDPADASSLSETVARLVGDAELRRTLATAGRAAVGGRTWSAVVDELIDVHYPLSCPAAACWPREGGRPPLVVAVTALAAVAAALAAAALVSVVHLQARAARRVIGKPLGESAPVAREVYGRSTATRSTCSSSATPSPPGSAPAARTRPSVPSWPGAWPGRPTAPCGCAARRMSAPRRRCARPAGGASAGYLADVAVIVVGGNDVTHRVRPPSPYATCARWSSRWWRRAEVVVGTCPDLGALGAVPQPLRTLAGRPRASWRGAARHW